MRAFHPVRLTRYRLSFDGATISRVQLNLTNFHGRGLIGFINYACTTRTTGAALPKTRQPCCPARAWTCRGVARPVSRTPVIPPLAFSIREIEGNDRSDRSTTRASNAVQGLYGMRAYIQDLLIKFCALRYLCLSVSSTWPKYWPITARGKFLVSTPTVT